MNNSKSFLELLSRDSLKSKNVKVPFLTLQNAPNSIIFCLLILPGVNIHIVLICVLKYPGTKNFKLLPYFGWVEPILLRFIGVKKGLISCKTTLGTECCHVKLSHQPILHVPMSKYPFLKVYQKSQNLRIGWNFQDLFIGFMGMSTNFFGAQLCLVLKQWPSENFGVNFWILLHYQESFYAKLTPC